jgi:hypothetical protein
MALVLIIWGAECCELPVDDCSNCSDHDVLLISVSPLDFTAYVLVTQ